MLTTLLFVSFPGAVLAASRLEAPVAPPADAEGHAPLVAAGFLVLCACFGWLLWRRHDGGSHS